MKGRSMNLKPLEDRIVVKQDEAPKESPGGIIIPDPVKEKPQQGTVMAIGEGKVADNGQRIEMSVKACDTILYGKYSGTEIEVDGEEYIIMRESDVLAIL